MLFMKGKTGGYKPQGNIGGGSPGFLRTKNLGYNDLYIGGPGFEFPVIRWDGKIYKYHKKIKDAQLANTTDLVTFSKAYTDTVNR